MFLAEEAVNCPDFLKETKNWSDALTALNRFVPVKPDVLEISFIPEPILLNWSTDKPRC